MSLSKKCAVLATVFLAAGAAAPQKMGSKVDPLNFRVIDAEYSKSLGLIVAVSGTPTASLHAYDPVTKSDNYVRLPLPGTCVSVSPDGTKAVVGHDAWITYVDLKKLAIISTIRVSTNAFDVVLAGNGYAYVFPERDQWVRIRCINLSTKKETLGSGTIYARTRAKLHPNGLWIYGATTGLSPSDIEKYDISKGTIRYLYDSPYHGTYAMSGNLWITEDGMRIFVRGGNVFRSSAIRSQDMVYNGRLGHLRLIQWVDYSSKAGKVLAIPEKPYYGSGPDDTELQVYDYKYLSFAGSFRIPTTKINSLEYKNHGRFVFFEKSGNRAWILVQLDQASGALYDWGVVPFEFKATRLPLVADRDVLSLSQGGTQTLTLDAPKFAGWNYLLLGSASGTHPGIQIGYGSVVLPLNFDLIYFWHTASHPNQWPLSGSAGKLDGKGRATARFSLGPKALPPALAGLVLHHAYLVFKGTNVPFASNAVPVRFIP